MWASLQGRTDVVAALLDGRAPIETTDVEGNTPLMLAAREGRADTVKLLLSRGARAGARNNDGQSAQDMAVAAGYPKVAAMIKAGK
jgi:ankyrin repeat protein